MRRSIIRQAVSERLADNGFSPGWYRWHRGWLELIDGKKRIGRISIPATSKTTKAVLASILASLPHVGPPRPHPAMMKEDGGWRQLDLGSVWGDSR